MKRNAYREILRAAFFLMFAACASTPTARFTVEDLAGTKWANEEFTPTSGANQAEITTDGTMEFSSSLFPTEPPWTDKYTITKSWYDRKGDLWFQCTWEEIIGSVGDKAFVLSRISKSGTVWEGCWRGSDYPAELSELEGQYFIYYRR